MASTASQCPPAYTKCPIEIKLRPLGSTAALQGGAGIRRRQFGRAGRVSVAPVAPMAMMPPPLCPPGLAGSAARRPGRFARRDQRWGARRAAVETLQHEAAPLAGEVEEAVVVGAGPTGALLALRLAERGVNVKVYERTPRDPATGWLPEQFANSWNITLTARAFAALADAGVQLEGCLEEVGVRLQGRVVSSPSGRWSAIGYDWPALSLPAWALSELLIKEGMARYPAGVEGGEVGGGARGSISYHFGYECLRLDTPHKAAATVSFMKEDKEDGSAVICKETADLVVGADGIGSAVRAHLQRCCPGFVVSQDWHGATVGVAVQFRPADAMGPEAVLEPGVDVSSGLGSGGKLTALGDALYMALGQGGLSGAVVSPNAPDSAGRSFNLIVSANVSPNGTTVLDDKVGDAHKLAEFVRSSFPSVAQLLTEDAYVDLAKSRPRGNRTVTCNRFHAGRVVLVGDAAHGMLNNLAQGANSALEDCSVLMDALEEGSEVEEALAKFTETRRAPVAAATLLSRDAFVVPKILQGPMWYNRILGLSRWLHRTFPRLFDPAWQTMVNAYNMQSIKSYVEIANARQRQHNIFLSVVAAGVITFLGVAVWLATVFGL